MDYIVFKDLFYAILDYNGDAAYWDVILPWLDDVPPDAEPLKLYGQIAAKDIKRGRGRKNLNWDHITTLWYLYGLSRINDLMLMEWSKGSHGYLKWDGTYFSHYERGEFLSAYGMRLVEQAVFHPFYHEIVEVEQSPDAAEPITVVETIWPCFMLGQMMFSRAGVKVHGGSDFIDKEIAENSTMYWTFTRKNRPTYDHSVGWGANSQWSTDFRRDYEDDTAFYYNVDGDFDVHKSTAPLSVDESIELLTNRCAIKSSKSSGDLEHSFSSERTYVEKKL